jgi:site-specific DNA-methyltransferase (cytosine-N4-specific)
LKKLKKAAKATVATVVKVARRRAKTDIPVGTQFTPALVDLKQFLAALVAHIGNKKAMAAAVWAPPVRLVSPKGPLTKRLKSLPLEAAVQYGLLDDRYAVTELAKQLASAPEPQMYEEFARHILHRLGGLRVIHGIRAMVRDGLPVTGDSLAEYLTRQGFRVTVHNTAINSMRLWLAKAAVFVPPGPWNVDYARVDEILGVTHEDVVGLVSLSADQRAFALALSRINPTGPHSAADVRELAEQILGTTIPRDSLPNRVLEALKERGYIDYKTGGTRGGKATLLETTAKFKSEVLTRVLEGAIASLDPVLTAYYQKTPHDIYADLDSKKTELKGKALEAYAVHIMRLMGFHFVGWRKRAAQSTGNAEVDVVMRGLFGNSPTRWQVQCKNTPGTAVDLEDVAKEVGLVPLTNATHVLVIANAPFTKEARRYAAEIMRATPLTIFLLDAKDFEKVRKSPGALARILRVRAEEMAEMRRKETMWGW